MSETPRSWAGVLAGTSRWHVECADAASFARTLPAGCIQTCVTSPPYFGLRDYGTGEWQGGDGECQHLRHNDAAAQYIASANVTGLDTQLAAAKVKNGFKESCGKCGARRVDSQIGLEASPAEFVARLVEVFAAIRDTLADDGTLWVNIGDSYASAWPAPSDRRNLIGQAMNGGKRGPLRQPRGMDESKEKEVMGIPWKLAFALSADGWYLRQDIIWSKPNPMPESVTDRCTKSHEYLFLLAKSERYYFDSEAMQEPAVYAGQNRGGSVNRYEQNAAGMDCKQFDTRNKRSVWTVCPASFKGAHFATFPPALIEPCILAGSREGDIVYDPFAGSGTTIAVAIAQNRRGLGSELNPKYCRLIQRRLRSVTPALV